MINQEVRRSANLEADDVQWAVMRELNPTVFDWSGYRPRVAVMLDESCESELEREIRLSLVWGSTGRTRSRSWSRLSPDPNGCTLSHGTLSGTTVCVLRNYFHLTDGAPHEPLRDHVRLQVEMLFSLGVESLIVVNEVEPVEGVGLLPGQVVVVDGFCTLFAPDMPLYFGESCNPEAALLRHGDLARSVVERVTGRQCAGGHVMVRGPLGKYDKALLRATGASVVGTSMLPEASIAALHGIPMIGLGIVKNTADEAHSDEENRRHAKDGESDLEDVLTALIEAVTKG